MPCCVVPKLRCAVLRHAGIRRTEAVAELYVCTRSCGGLDSVNGRVSRYDW